MNEEFDRIFNNKIDTEQPTRNQEQIEAISYMRSVYWPKANQKGTFKYFATNDEIELATLKALTKYGIETLKNFHNFASENGLCGKRDTWTLNAINEDIDEFLGKKKPVVKKEVPKISDFEQSCRYIHLVYAPNQINVDILREPPIPKLVKLTQDMVNKFGHKAIEILIDYCNWHRETLYKKKWSNESVERDIKAAIKWSIENPDEYLKNN